MPHPLKSRMGFRVLAAALAIASAAMTSAARAGWEDDRPVRETATDPGAYANAAYTKAAEPETSAPSPAVKASAKGKQATAGRRGAKDAGQPYIEFRSRYALSYGHTFVVFGRLNSKGEVGEIKPEMVAGLHPKGDSSAPWTVGHVVPVPSDTGWSDGDLEEEYVSNRFRVLLTEEKYAKLVAHIRQKQASSPLWHAALYNCNLWTGEIAQYLGLKTGFHWLPPAEYIQKIKDLNSAGQQAALGGATQADASLVR